MMKDSDDERMVWKRGAALPVALWLLIIIVSLGTVFLILMSGSYLSASKLRYENGAYYLAYSGIMYAKAKLDEDGLSDGESFTFAIDQTGITQLNITRSGGNWAVESIGLYGQNGKTMAKRSIKATISEDGILQWQNI